jgi:hypothetical protein
MQHHHNEPRPPGAGTEAHRLQRLVLLELVADPPPAGDRVEDVADRLLEPRLRVQVAVTALEAAGLAARAGDRVRASATARYFDALWPVAL